jgi:hypothetical protein
VKDAANVVALKNGTNAQEFRVYGTTTGSQYLRLMHDGTSASVINKTSGNLLLGVNNVSVWQITSAGSLYAVADNSYDIGQNGNNRPKDIYVSGKYYGDGSSLTGIAGVVGGYTNTGNTSIIGGSTGTGTVSFHTGNAAGAALQRWNITTGGAGTGGHLVPQVSASYDIGAAATFARAVYSQQFAANGAVSANHLYMANLGASLGVIKATQASGETSAISIIDLATTWNNAANAPTAIKLVVTDSASNAASLLMDLRTDAGSKFSVSKAGVLTTASSIYSGNANLGFNTFGYIAAQSDGVWKLSNNAGSDFTRLQFGGTTSSFPALKRNGMALDIRLADDSAYAGLNLGYLGVNGNGALAMNSDGVLKVTNAAGTDFTRLQFGGTDDTFPALARSTTDLSIVGGAGGTANSSLMIPGQKATTGQRYVCITTTGRLVSSATACSGT